MTTTTEPTTIDIVAISRKELIAALEDVLERVRRDDSYEGFIRWLIPDSESADPYEREAALRQDDVMVQIRYWVDCSKPGEGRMRMLRRLPEQGKQS